MANVVMSDRKFELATAKNGTNNYVLGDTNNDLVGTWAIMVVNTSSLVASIAVKARIRGPYAATDAVGFVPISYLKLYLNGAVGDNTLVTTAITDTSLIFVPASGLSVSLDVTFTSGTGTIYSWPLEGAAA